MKLVLAYLDPGTGSMVLQIIVGGVAAIGVAGRYYWQKVTGKSPKKVEGEPSPDTETPTTVE